MSSLVPGPIFISSGLNRNSTPTPPSTTPSQLDARYRRVDFNGHEWPKESPVARAYDVANTSTKLIILNNKYGKGSTRLRGYYTGPKRPERHIDPNRHRAPSPRNPDYHTACYDSSSPKFEPAVKTDLEWINASHRPPNALIARTAVNPRRHATCMSSPEVPVHDQRPRSRMSLPPNKYFTNSEYADMSIGEKIYMWSIEKIYNMDRMKQLKQEQYKKLLNMEAKKGYHGYQEYAKYMRYINSAKDRTYGTGSPSRSRSAYSPRSVRSRSAASRASPTKSETRSEEDMEKDKEEVPERPKTSIGHTRQEPLNDTKPSDSETKKRAASAGSGSQRSQQKSPSPSGRSSAKSSGSGSQRSLRSKSGSRASSAKGEEKTKGDHSDSSLSNNNDDVPQLHKEGKDRPKSRLGHPGIEDRDQAVAEGEGAHIHHEGKNRPKSRLGPPGGDNKDKDSLSSSTLSIKSDNTSLSSDSGVGNGRKARQTKQSPDTSSLSSVDSRNRRGNNQTKRKKDQLEQPQSAKAKQSKQMGSRSSVSSKSSSKSDENMRTGNQSKGGKKNEEVVNSEKTGKAESSETKVLKIPSGTILEEEKSLEKAGDKSDNDKVNIKSTNAKDSEADNGHPQEEGRQPDVNKTDDIKNADVEQKSGYTANDKSNEVETDKGNVEMEFVEHDLVDNDKENKVQRVEGESKDKTVVGDSQPTKQEDDTKLTQDNGKNKLTRQDSFEDEDEDRRMNKDPDKLEY